MDQQKAAKWSYDSGNADYDDNLPAFNGSTQDLDSLWYDGIDFSASAPGPGNTAPSLNDDLDNFTYNQDNFHGIDNFSPLQLPSPNILPQNDVFDLSTLQSLVQQSSPAPRQHTLPRRRSKYMMRRPGSNSSPVNIQNPPSPFQPVAIERWRNSPPEQEAASLSAIYHAMEEQPTRSGNHTPNFNVYRNHRGASSTTSLESAVSESSLHSVKSNQSSKSQRRKGKVTKPRTSAKGKAKPKDGADRIFKCTFCCDTFKHKYDWSRHEKSLHLNMEEWVCAPHGKSTTQAHSETSADLTQ
jgi:hypothetical protein